MESRSHETNLLLPVESRVFEPGPSRVLYFVPGLRSRTWTVEIFSRAGTHRGPETAHWAKPSGVFDGHDRFGTSLFPQLVLFLLRDIILRRPKEPHGLEQGAIDFGEGNERCLPFRWYFDKYGDVARLGVRWVV